jgi:hypothetical protein
MQTLVWPSQHPEASVSRFSFCIIRFSSQRIH